MQICMHDFIFVCNWGKPERPPHYGVGAQCMYVSYMFPYILLNCCIDLYRYMYVPYVILYVLLNHE